jgi:hypothetical protein
MNKEICGACGEKIAVYWYMPGYYPKSNPFHCENCVPRGCDCNKGITDSQGREKPCEEYMFDKNGFEKD